MAFKIRLATASLASTFALTSEAAALTINSSTLDAPLPAGHHLVVDFDGYLAPGYALSLEGATGVFNGAAGLVAGVAAPPPGTTSNYLSLQAGGSATLWTPLINSFSVYIGSPDPYNSVRFIGLNGYDQALSGAALAGGAFGGDQSVGRRMTYSFGDQRLTQVIFSSSGNSFELDNIAVGSAVPELGAWSLMIVGFAIVGGALRLRGRAWMAAVSSAGSARFAF